MSQHGPPPVTRLVLEGMSLLMDRDGGNCWAGVRRLSEMTGLDKSTVAKHRALAVSTGWLIPGEASRHSRYQTFSAALPDGVHCYSSTKDREQRGTGPQSAALSVQPGQLSNDSLSSLPTSTVRSSSPDCTCGPDKPLRPREIPLGIARPEREPTSGPVDTRIAAREMLHALRDQLSAETRDSANTSRDGTNPQTVIQRTAGRRFGSGP